MAAGGDGRQKGAIHETGTLADPDTSGRLFRGGCCSRSDAWGGSRLGGRVDDSDVSLGGGRQSEILGLGGRHETVDDRPWCDHVSVRHAGSLVPHQGGSNLPSPVHRERVSPGYLLARVGRPPALGIRQDNQPGDVPYEPRDQAGNDRHARGLDRRRSRVEHRPARAHGHDRVAGGCSGGHQRMAPRIWRSPIRRRSSARAGRSASRCIPAARTWTSGSRSRTRRTACIRITFGTAPPFRTGPARGSSTR